MLLALLFFLLAAHALMDYALQHETMALCKCRGCEHAAARAVPWYFWLTAHAVLHGAAVGAVVRWFGFDWMLVAILAIAESVLHWFIDHGKCLKWYGIALDQSLHVACKVVMWALFAAGILDAWKSP